MTVAEMRRPSHWHSKVGSFYGHRHTVQMVSETNTVGLDEKGTRARTRRDDAQRYTRAMGEKAKNVEEYLNALNPAYKAELEQIRTLVKQLVPDTEETLSYGMPTLKYKNRALVFFTASKKHMSFYPSSWAIEELRDQLQDFKTTEHAILFTPDSPLSSRLIEDLVRVHVREIDANRQ
ncbi:iron chaperone [Glutamicibacter sp. AOP5-A2-18]|uniref:iron chaperone n=1 Tax=Glutamicibacter sp. AOP5-A2-18 TaxID=3457656 RepID=UPI0040346F42